MSYNGTSERCESLETLQISVMAYLGAMLSKAERRFIEVWLGTERGEAEAWEQWSKWGGNYRRVMRSRLRTKRYRMMRDLELLDQMASFM